MLNDSSGSCSSAVRAWKAFAKCWRFAALGLLLGCQLCKEEIWNNSTSPDGKWTATTVMRDCGATTSEVVSVNVHPANEHTLRQKNNVLVVNHGRPISVAWKDSNTLIVGCRECIPKEVFSKSDKAGPIRIEFDLP